MGIEEEIEKLVKSGGLSQANALAVVMALVTDIADKNQKSNDTVCDGLVNLENKLQEFEGMVEHSVLMVEKRMEERIAALQAAHDKRLTTLEEYNRQNPSIIYLIRQHPRISLAVAVMFLLLVMSASEYITFDLFKAYFSSQTGIPTP